MWTHEKSPELELWRFWLISKLNAKQVCVKSDRHKIKFLYFTYFTSQKQIFHIREDIHFQSKCKIIDFIAFTLKRHWIIREYNFISYLLRNKNTNRMENVPICKMKRLPKQTFYGNM